MSMKNSHDTIWNRTSHLRICSTAPWWLFYRGPPNTFKYTTDYMLYKLFMELRNAKRCHKYRPFKLLYSVFIFWCYVVYRARLCEFCKVLSVKSVQHGRQAWRLELTHSSDWKTYWWVLEFSRFAWHWVSQCYVKRRQVIWQIDIEVRILHIDTVREDFALVHLVQNSCLYHHLT